MAREQLSESAKAIVDTAALEAAAVGVVGGFVPLADLAGIGAIWAKMVYDLAKESGREIDSEMAKKIAVSVTSGATLYIGSDRVLGTLVSSVIPGVGETTQRSAILDYIYTNRFGAILYHEFRSSNFTAGLLAVNIAGMIATVFALPGIGEISNAYQIINTQLPASASEAMTGVAKNTGEDWDSPLHLAPHGMAPQFGGIRHDLPSTPIGAPPSPPSVPASAPTGVSQSPSAPPPVAPPPSTQPDYSQRGEDTPTPANQDAAHFTPREQVTFTAFHPREMQPQQWQPLVVYLSLDNPATLALVAAAAAERLAGKLDQFRPGRADMPSALARGARLRLVPSAPGFQFNPAYLDVTWEEDVQQHEFRMRAETAQPGQAVNGVVRVFQGMLLRGEVPISVFVGNAVAQLDSPDAYARAIARAYRRIFASYSHKDMPVVESCESAARTMGDQYLRDVTLLQAGVQWDPRLIQAINEADIFQLFWSKRAATSPFVEREWRHALELLPARPDFIRPVYWTHRLYPVPPELRVLHFQPLSLSSLGWGRLRTGLYQLRS